jgi:kynurenine formamidase
MTFTNASPEHSAGHCDAHTHWNHECTQIDTNSLPIFSGKFVFIGVYSWFSGPSAAEFWLRGSTFG